MAHQPFLLALLPLVLPLSATAPTAEGETPVYGAEANPTGDPIGGGEGYRRIVTQGDYSVRTPEELLAALNAAKPGQVVCVAAERIDLAGHTNIRIPPGVTLAGNRGKGGSPGPLLFNDRMPSRHGLFQVEADARVTALRLKGSDVDVAETDYEAKERTYLKCITAAGANVEVDNCEISNFHHSGVDVQSKNVRIHHNLIHDVHAYPVVVGSRAGLPTLIEANIIRWVWTALNGTGAPGTGYEARYNLIICEKPPKSWGEAFKSHAFGMHLFRPAQPLRIASDQILIHHNTLEMGRSFGVRIRGVPREIMDIHSNWFQDEDPSRAIAPHPGNVWVHNNVYGPRKTLLPVGPGTTPQILFRRPHPPSETPEKVSGVLPLDIEVNVLKGVALKSVRIEVGGKVVYTGPTQKPMRPDDARVEGASTVVYEGPRAPTPGEAVVDTRALPDGCHELTVTAVDNRDVAARHSVMLAVEN
ncbi:MAG: right-handed parallel beta-helix repeat-containing protein [Armatimonadetes bacterium]|nr:right-handed parallel beta-helix repeat-containing protein [Armatimonadota bacterium]